MKYRLRNPLDSPTIPSKESFLTPVRTEPIHVDELVGQYQIRDLPENLERVTNSRLRRKRRRLKS